MTSGGMAARPRPARGAAIAPVTMQQIGRGDIEAAKAGHVIRQLLPYRQSLRSDHTGEDDLGFCYGPGAFSLTTKRIFLLCVHMLATALVECGAAEPALIFG